VIGGSFSVNCGFCGGDLRVEVLGETTVRGELVCGM
jgi:hypothetical protein